MAGKYGLILPFRAHAHAGLWLAAYLKNRYLFFYKLQTYGSSGLKKGNLIIIEIEWKYLQV